MKNTSLLEQLKQINYLSDKAKAQEKIEKLIAAIQQEIIVEDNKGLSSKQRLNYCMNLAKKLQNGTKPVLGYACSDQIEGMQVFTNSFFLVALAEPDKLPIADYKESKRCYPVVTRIVIPGNYGVKSFTCNVGKLLNYFKAHKILHLVNESTGFNVLLSEENIKDLVTFMNYNTKDTITLYARTLENTENSTSLSPVYTKNKNGSYGIALPIRESINTRPLKITEKDVE